MESVSALSFVSMKKYLYCLTIPENIHHSDIVQVRHLDSKILSAVFCETRREIVINTADKDFLLIEIDIYN
jgi:hypothetical protein